MTALKGYENFDLRVKRDAERYVVQVEATLGKAARSRFSLPDGLETEVRTSFEQLSEERARAIGRQLFEAVFQQEGGQVLGSFNATQGAARSADKGVRIRFLHEPTTAWVPWELLCDPADPDLPLSVSAWTPVIRCSLSRERDGAVPASLSMLVILCDPPQYSDSRIDIGKELTSLRESLRPQGERASVVPLENKSADQVRESLRSGQYNAVHFSGHSDFDAKGNAGLVVLTAAGGGPDVLSADAFRALLKDLDLQLVVINSCRSGAESEASGALGFGLVQAEAEIPVVVAMQFRVADEDALAFSRDFYKTLAKGEPVEVAIAEARNTLFRKGAKAWAAPVLYQHLKEARLFEAPGRRRRRLLAEVVPTLMLTVNLLLALFWTKQSRWFFVSWWDYVQSLAGALSAVIAVLLPFVLQKVPNVAATLEAAFRTADGGLRKPAIGASLALSLALAIAAWRAAPRFEMARETVVSLEDDRTAGGSPETLVATPYDEVGAARWTCPIELARTTRYADKPCLPLRAHGYDILRLHLGRNVLPEDYRLTLSPLPRLKVRFGAARIDPRVGIGSDAASASLNTDSLTLELKGNAAAASRSAFETRMVLLRASDLREPALLRAALWGPNGIEVGNALLETCWELLAGRERPCPVRAEAR